MADIPPTLAVPTGTNVFLRTQTNNSFPDTGVTPLVMEYNNTTLNEMMTSYSDCFEFSNDTDLDIGLNNSTMYVSIQPLNNSNCSLFTGNHSVQSPINVTSECNPVQEYFSWSYALVGTLFQSIIFVVGVLGNVLTCTVVHRTRSMHTTTNCYLGVKSIKDYYTN